MDETSVQDIVRKAERAVQSVLNNSIKVPTCPEKKKKAIWKREKVVSELVAKLMPGTTTGPSELK